MKATRPSLTEQASGSIETTRDILFRVCVHVSCRWVKPLSNISAGEGVAHRLQPISHPVVSAEPCCTFYSIFFMSASKTILIQCVNPSRDELSLLQPARCPFFIINHCMSMAW